MAELSGKTAVVTGAAQGLGAAVARLFAAEGAALHLIDVKAEPLRALADELAAGGARVTPVVLDITDSPALRAAIAAAGAGGRLDILVNNAAIQPPTFSILEETEANWARTLAVNLTAQQVASEAAARLMVPQRCGRIVHVTSVQGFVSSGRCGSYNAAKGGLIALTKSMAVELGPFGIAVNAVAPGFMRTPMSVVDGVDETETDEFRAWYVERGRIPLRRAGLPEEVAQSVLFLASDRAQYLTGHVLVVDGGLTATF
jgi:NAD(P)-dependent dehydrogenase (short-subunit alcohol dehydrogenase family)